MIEQEQANKDVDKKEIKTNKLNKENNKENKEPIVHFNRFIVFNALEKFKKDIFAFIETLLYTLVPPGLIIIGIILINAQELYLWEVIAGIGIYALVFELLFKRLQLLYKYQTYFKQKNVNFKNMSKSDEKKVLRNEEVKYIRNKKQQRKIKEKKEREDYLIKKEDELNHVDNSLKSKIKSIFRYK